ncbi:hypothetical protein SDRG_00365 [Saprolegnia diclina VS20]|uniref:Uncharacterized protein n=1 Tax=Saprolegnia diclina (strain VS20) TaxID=1156394 RepID=T0SIC1_SAPDV|nr:hypothetical protein SDRG_00365 [Saprolegnia diclina VS20]EQC42637.1 hypothetical protein SDRG_00365 [Saprolegnia diclina VS20]|eukprot:XP_008604060.1 hypothetical protein SDRG_00365 [Saprolegnia diclina VS20]
MATDEPHARFGLHLPLVYGAKAKSALTPSEQQNRLHGLWISEAQRVVDADVAERTEAMSLPHKLARKANIYLAENRRLDMLLRRKPTQAKMRSLTKQKKKKKTNPRIVDDMLALEHRYRECAKVVQKAWRRYSQKQFWATYVRYVRASVEIQRIMRGVLTRKWVRVWYLSQLRFVSKIQATYRSFLYQRVLATKFQWESYNASVIQRYTRGYFGRRRALAIKRHLAALHVQMLWRGVASRKRSDAHWLSRSAIVVQKHMRRFLVQRKTRSLRAAYDVAAVHIQRLFRGMRARVRVDSMLFERETTNRKLVMDVLDAELVWYKEHVQKLQRRVDKSKLETLVVQMESEHHRAHVRINDMECVYIDMQEQRLKMSPRAITDGWLYEMEAKIKAQRAQITAAKLDAVFGHGLRFRASVTKLQTLQRQRDDAIARRDEIERWRVEEFLDYWERDMHHMAILRARQRQQKIADERRKWRVTPCTKEGKVRLHAAARESTVFCIGSSNLLAFSKEFQAQKSAVTALTEQVALVSSTAQLEQAQTMLMPLLDTFTKTYNGVHQALHNAPPRPHAVAIERSTSVDPPLETEIVVKKKVKTLGQQRRMRDAHVPWSLLDQLAAEKTKLQTEKALGAVFKRRKPIGDD